MASLSSHVTSSSPVSSSDATSMDPVVLELPDNAPFLPHWLWIGADAPLSPTLISTCSSLPISSSPSSLTLSALTTLNRDGSRHTTYPHMPTQVHALPRVPLCSLSRTACAGLVKRDEGLRHHMSRTFHADRSSIPAKSKTTSPGRPNLTTHFGGFEWL